MRDLCEARNKARVGDTIEIIAGLCVTPEKLRAWCDAMGDHLIRAEPVVGAFVADIRVAGGETDCNAKPYR